MPVGTVKSFDASKGYGAIKPADSSADIIANIDEIRKAGDTALVDGVRVNYTVTTTKAGKPVVERRRIL